ncbi:MAG: 50S ribosomal protein L1 [Candidatus Thermoplasmatota archaeon]|nr:50S ribosomal protein L1 [bacterium]MEC7349819.1 50S ribosomal protein L1 [Candidatus Thermoplasmatota archaeon]MEC8671835.1 50S ribosomal protein L1 [Candidatus Thermoplasmatota archaeon]MEE3081766.1 50S ribosomal protein L1 [Candidatus Thermoplasmatota archaeon]
MASNKINQAIADALSSKEERKFVETVEVAINLKDVDLQNPQKRINAEVALPHGRGRPARVAVFAQGEMAVISKKVVDTVISPEQIDELSENKREARKLAGKFDFFVAETGLMANIGKSLGVVLGPRGKMPRPIPPQADIERIIKSLTNLVPVRSKDRPTFHVPIGNVKMSQEQLAENLETILKRVESSLDRGYDNIASVWVKTTMGKSVRLE